MGVSPADMVENMQVKNVRVWRVEFRCVGIRSTVFYRHVSQSSAFYQSICYGQRSVQSSSSSLHGGLLLSPHGGLHQ